MNKFQPDWYFVAANGMHYVDSLHRGTLCGLQVSRKRLYTGHSTQHCKRCLKYCKKGVR